MNTLTIKSLHKDLSAEKVAILYCKRVGLGLWKGWEFWYVFDKDFLNRETRYFFAIKEGVILVDYLFTNILEYVEKENGEMGKECEQISLDAKKE